MAGWAWGKIKKFKTGTKITQLLHLLPYPERWELPLAPTEEFSFLHVFWWHWQVPAERKGRKKNPVQKEQLRETRNVLAKQESKHALVLQPSSASSLRVQYACLLNWCNNLQIFNWQKWYSTILQPPHTHVSDIPPICKDCKTISFLESPMPAVPFTSHPISNGHSSPAGGGPGIRLCNTLSFGGLVYGCAFCHREENPCSNSSQVH